MVFNRERGEWPLTVGDKQYKMRLTTNAMAEVEDLAKGKPWDRILEGLMRGSVSDCRLLMWAALRDHHPEIATDSTDSLKRIGDLVDEAGGLTAITAQIREFVEGNARPGGDGKKAAGDPPPAAGTTTAGTGATPTPGPSRSA